MIILIYVLIDIFINMAVKTADLLTVDELYNNYEYKVTKRVILNDFPWIKNMTFDGGNINEYNLIFITLHMDPFELSDMTGFGVYKWALKDIEEGHTFSTSYLSSMMNITYEQAKPTTEKIDETFKSVHKSQAIPQDLKLPYDRRLAVGDFKTLKGLTIPTNYVNWRNIIKDKLYDTPDEL